LLRTFDSPFTCKVSAAANKPSSSDSSTYNIKKYEIRQQIPDKATKTQTDNPHSIYQIYTRIMKVGVTPRNNPSLSYILSSHNHVYVCTHTQQDWILPREHQFQYICSLLTAWKEMNFKF
jgi:hypothetical protein